MAASDFFKRVLLSTRERPTSADMNRLIYRAMETSRMIQSEVFGEAYSGSPATAYADRFSLVAPQGFHAGGFQVLVDPGAPPFGVRIAPGIGTARTAPATATDIDSDTGANWDNSVAYGAPLVLSSYQAFTVPAAPAPGNSRIDTIEVKASYLATDAASVGIFNLLTRVFDTTSRNKALSWDLLGLTGSVSAPAASTQPISYVQGVNFAGGIAGAAEPATTAGYVKIARINLDGAVAAIAQNLIADMRPLILPNGMLHVAGNLSLPGTAVGLGTEAWNAQELPGGLTMAASYNNAVPPAAGQSYDVTVYLIGGNFTSRRGSTAGVAIGGGGLSNRIVATTAPATGQVIAAVRTIISGLSAPDIMFAVAPDIALGQPYTSFQLRVYNPTGAAVSATETAKFTFTQSMS